MKLDNLLLQLPIPYIIFGDFTAHSQMLGNCDSNQHGDMIETFISGNGLCLLHNGDCTYFHEPT